ncbi:MULTISPECIES: hypothetical protein [unclassified Caballeronia]|uniref:hypothetical protein n=1 Tax=unclassified Caballeronia TaxID=2646786 RepID=UPI002029667C|nr:MULTISPECIES: hypothetical protein [unclassified Caballeronia]MDR5767682.1 hypothetical protein [Caballeronia sp. LZ028]
MGQRLLHCALRNRVCGFVHFRRKTVNLSEEIDRRCDIHPPIYVITAGTLSMVLDSDKRLKGFDVYTNPEKWVACSLPLRGAVQETPHIETSFDANGHGNGHRGR